MPKSHRHDISPETKRAIDAYVSDREQRAIAHLMGMSLVPWYKRLFYWLVSLRSSQKSSARPQIPRPPARRIANLSWAPRRSRLVAGEQSAGAAEARVDLPGQGRDLALPGRNDRKPRRAEKGRHQVKFNPPMPAKYFTKLLLSFPKGATLQTAAAEDHIPVTSADGAVTYGALYPDKIIVYNTSWSGKR